MSAIDLHNQVRCRRGTGCGWNRHQVLRREDTSHFIGESFDLSVVINLAWLTVEFLQIPLRFSVAVDNALLALKLRQVWMNVGAKDWLDGGWTRPMTLWVDAVMFMDTQLVIAKNSMEARGMSAILSQLLTTVRTDFRVGCN